MVGDGAEVGVVILEGVVGEGCQQRVCYHYGGVEEGAQEEDDSKDGYWHVVFISNVISGHIEVLATLHSQVRLVTTHLLQNVRVLNIVRHRVRQSVVMLTSVPHQPRLSHLQTTPSHTPSGQHIQILPILIDFLLMLFPLVSLQFSRSFAILLKSLFFSITFFFQSLLPLSSLINLHQQLISIIIASLSLFATSIMLLHHIFLALLVDAFAYQGLF